MPTKSLEKRLLVSTLKMLNPSQEEIRSAQSFAKTVMGQAFDNNMTAVSLIIAAESLKYTALSMLENGDDAECNCPDCVAKYKKMEMN